MISLAKGIDGLPSYDVVKNEMIDSNNIVCISSLINSLSYQSSCALSKIINNISKLRQKKNIKVVEQKKLVNESETKLSVLKQSIKNNEFFDLSSETLSNIMLNLIQDVHVGLIEDNEKN